MNDQPISMTASFARPALRQDRRPDRACCRIDRKAGRGRRRGAGRSDPLNLFWFAPTPWLMAALTRLPAVPCLSYGNAPIWSASSVNDLRGIRT